MEPNDSSNSVSISPQTFKDANFETPTMHENKVADHPSTNGSTMRGTTENTSSHGIFSVPPESSRDKTTYLPENSSGATTYLPENSSGTTTYLPENSRDTMTSLPENSRDTMTSLPENSRDTTSVQTDNFRDVTPTEQTTWKQGDKTLPSNTISTPGITDTKSIRSTHNDTTTITNQTVVMPTLAAVKEILDEMDANETDFNDTQEKPSQEQKSSLSSQKLKMQVSLQNARQSLHDFFSPFAENQKIPSRLFNETKGIVFLHVIKGAFGIGGAFGSGVILARNNNQWSTPCAISLTGLQIGFDIGIERVDYILLLRDEHALKHFQCKKTWNVGTDISIAAGPVGGDINVGFVANDSKTITTVYSYSMAKGAYIGVSLNGSLITIRDDWNEEFYGHKMSLNEIYNNNNICINEEYTSLISILNECCRIR